MPKGLEKQMELGFVFLALFFHPLCPISLVLWIFFCPPST